MSSNNYPFEWEINFQIENSKISEIYQIKGMKFIPSKDKDTVTLVSAIVSTEEFNSEEARKAAFKRLNAILDAYCILTGFSLTPKHVGEKLLRRPQLPKGTVLLMPSRSPTITVHVFISIYKDDLEQSKYISKKINKRKDVTLLNKIISWYRKGLASQDPYDRFIYSWIAFNALYNHLGKGKSEANRMTDLVGNFLNAEEGERIIVGHTKDISHLVVANIFSRRRKTNYSKRIKIKINNQDFNGAIKYTLLSIYEVRCDLFHGEEILSNESRQLVKSANNVLNEILRKCLLSILGFISI